MNLDPSVRATLAASVTRCLAAAVDGSRAGLRGSLASGGADPLSDIDAFWELPDDSFETSLERLPEILSQVRPLESVRSHPLIQNSPRRRLIFVQFAGVPLYWRLDLEVFAASIGMDSSYDLDNSAARGDDWSQTHSALMDGVTALKALVRGDSERAGEVLCAAFVRLGLEVPEEPAWQQVESLTEAVGRIDLEQARLARRVQILRGEALELLARRGAKA